MTAKIGTIRMERNRAIKGQKDMRKSNLELTRELAASRALCDQHFNTIIELRAALQAPHGECNECGKKQTDGFALYCVQCADSALIGCQYPLCKSESEQKDIADQVHAELYSGILPELLPIATGYESGTMISGLEELSGTIKLHYESAPEADDAFKCITNIIDAINSSRKKSNAKP